MPIYVFKCSKQHVIEEYRRLADFSRSTICKCGMLAELQLNTHFHISIFNPYTEENLTGKPIEITTRKQRDALCKQHGVTYDTAKFARKPKVVSAASSITFDDVKKALESGKDADGVPIQEPVKLTKKEQKQCSVI